LTTKNHSDLGWLTMHWISLQKSSTSQEVKWDRASYF